MEYTGFFLGGGEVVAFRFLPSLLPLPFARTKHRHLSAGTGRQVAMCYAPVPETLGLQVGEVVAFITAISTSNDAADPIALAREAWVQASYA